MNYFQQIDTVLAFFKEKAELGGSFSYQNVWDFVVSEKNLKIGDRTRLISIIDRLVEDGFVKKVELNENWPAMYHVSFKGLLFQGYERESQSSSQQAQTLSEIATGTYRIQKGMFWLTLVLAIGTTIAALYYLMEIAKYLGWICPSPK